jgi:hypothetical protein
MKRKHMVMLLLLVLMLASRSVETLTSLKYPGCWYWCYLVLAL